MEELVGPAGLENAIQDLWIDGHGHLFVKVDIDPVEWDSATNGQRNLFPVDVYSPEGERIFAGFVDNNGWKAAQGNYLYDRGWDPESEEATFVRYIIHEPFR